jgi:tetratricopeptide (TPR) repeat protein
MWAEIYEEDAADIEILNARVAQAIIARLGVELSAEEASQLGATRAVNPEASIAYLDGRYWATSGRGRSAIESFRRAVEIDPGYAAAWAALANAYVYRLPSHENMPRARHAAQTALNLDESLGEAHAALAQVRFFFDWEWSAAESSFLRALALAPNSSTIRQRYASLLWAEGRLDEARHQLVRAEQLDPMSLFTKLELARTDYFARDYDAALAAYRDLLERDRDFWWAHMFLGISLQQAGRLDESAGALITAHRMLSDEVGTTLQVSFDASGYEGLMRAWITSGQNDDRVQPTSLAAQHAFIGDLDEAFRWLEIAFEQRTRALVWIGVDPQYDALRTDPRFGNLLQRMGLGG